MKVKDPVLLRDVIKADLLIFYEHQRDPDALRMAAFPFREREVFLAHWEKILQNESLIKQTIIFEKQVAGNIVSWEESGRRLIGYWIGKAFWGKGIATQALSMLLESLKTRPLYAHVAKQNIGSIRVLEKCGFTISSSEKRGSNISSEEPEEVIMILR